jgi:predicted DNA binding CopG/RHH family protein
MPTHIAFHLKDFFNEDPLRAIYSKRREDTYLLNAYLDYKLDLEFLRIAWQRLKQGCKEVGEIDIRIREIPPSSKNYDNEAASLWLRQIELVNILQHDVRSFIVTARVIMDKLAKIITKLLGRSPGKGQKVSFTRHKEGLPKYYPDIYHVYLDFLQNRTYWYEQELLLLRDKVLVHGNTFITPWGVSLEKGVIIMKRSELVGVLKEEDYKDLLDIKRKYEDKYSNLTVTENSSLMLDEFLQQSRRLNIKWDKADLNKITDIVSSFGIMIDEDYLESIAHHLEDFMKEVAFIFKDSI